MQMLRALGADLLCDRLPIKLWDNPGVQKALSDGNYRLVAMSDTHFDVEQKRLETSQMGTGIDSQGVPATAAAKVIAFPGIQRSKVGPEDRVIFLVRRPSDTCRSQKERYISRAHRLNYYRLVEHFEAWAATAPCPILYFDTDAITIKTLEGLAGFCGLPGDAGEALSLLDPKLSREPAEEVEDDAAHSYRKVAVKCR